MSSNFLTFNLSKTEFILIDLPKQPAKLNHPTVSVPDGVSICPVDSAHNLGVIFDSHLSFSKHVSNLSQSCFYHIRDLRCIRNTLDQKTACTIATSLIESKN